MAELRLCEGCNRHVFASEQRCPFCATSLPALTPKPQTLLQAGLSRAQRYAIAAAVAGTAATSCSKHHEEAPAGEAGSPAAGAGRGAGSAGIAGLAGNTAAGSTAAGNGSGVAGTAGDPFIPQPMYGGGFPQPVYGAPFVDAGSAAGSGAIDAGRADEDAGQDDTPPAMPIYGASFPWLKLLR
jgi:hypothetical protein